MFGKKGQGAMEYLMTYGWAILVVMIVGIVMWQLGIFNLGSSTPPRLSGFNYQRPMEATMIINGSGACQAAANDCLTLQVVNGEPGTITFRSSLAKVNNVVIGACKINGGTLASATVSQGDKYIVSCPGVASGPSAARGWVLTVYLRLDYDLQIAGQTRARNETGTGQGPSD